MLIEAGHLGSYTGQPVIDSGLILFYTNLPGMVSVHTAVNCN